MERGEIRQRKRGESSITETHFSPSPIQLIKHNTIKSCERSGTHTICIQKIKMIADSMEYKLEYLDALITLKNGGCSFVDYPNEPNIVSAVKQRMGAKKTPRKQRVLSDGKYYRVEYDRKKLSKVCKDIEKVMKRVGVTDHTRKLNLHGQ